MLGTNAVGMSWRNAIRRMAPIRGSSTTRSTAPSPAPAVAVMVAVPTLTAVTSPVAVTVAMPGLRETQPAAIPATAPPALSVRWLPSEMVSPAKRLGSRGSMLTTGAAKTVAVADFPSEVAVMTVDPIALPVTTPPELTWTMLGSALDQVTSRPEMGAPSESGVNTSSCWLARRMTVSTAGVTMTLSTGSVLDGLVTVGEQAANIQPRTAGRASEDSECQGDVRSSPTPGKDRHSIGYGNSSSIISNCGTRR